MTLERYQKKRDFRATPEPKGKAKRGKAKGHRFVVQKHDASRLHYDFRLQVGDVLVSWAVPKGPSLNPSHKRLAVHVEDHPLEYGDFEGVIPKGQYGGGTVMLWDTGVWAMDDGVKPESALKKGKLSFTLDGEKLHGGWTLTRLRSGKDDDGDNWLLIKHDDEFSSRKGESILEAQPNSVTTERTLEEIAAQESGEEMSSSSKERKKRGRTKKKGKSKKPAGKSVAPSALAKVPKAKKADVPRSVSPQLCTRTDKAPAGDDWIHEIKFDGYRLIARRTSAGVKLITRNGKDWSRKFPPIAKAIEALPVESAIIDGEATILDPRGHTSFQMLQNAIKKRAFDALAFYVFDLLYLDGYDLMQTPLIERKKPLRKLVPGTNQGLLRYSDHVKGSGRAFHEEACELALEGIVSKLATAPYMQQRSKTWLKVKCARRQEFIIIGWTPPSGGRKHFGSLLLGAYDGDGRLIYTGKVGTGFSAASLRDIRKRLDALSRKTNPADEGPDRAEARGAHWVTPELVGEVEFTAWTDDGRLRHPAFQGLREDKPAGEVRFERVQSVNEVVEDAVSEKKSATSKAETKTSTKKKSGRRATNADDEPVVLGVRISSADRVVYPEAGYTKLDLARYYESVAERMLPFVVNRPLSTVRCPQGRGKHCFFQKHVRETFAKPVKSVRVKEKDGEADYITIDSEAGLITLVQFGVMEIHPWGATNDDLERPDFMTFDLDPAPDVPFEKVKEGAALVRDELAALDLESFLKTTGGKGLHVVAPLMRSAGWDVVKAFCKAIAVGIAREHPKAYLATASKAKRKGRVFVDYLRNGRGATSIAPYSSRARENAPVAVPLRWDELASLKGANQYRIDNLSQRLGNLKSDPWKDFSKTRQKLSKARLTSVGAEV